MIHFTSERVVPWDDQTPINLLQKHVMRYALALGNVAGRRVVDLGCGCGYGAALLSWGAKSVLGVDVSQEAVSFARVHFARRNCDFERLDLMRDEIPDADLYVAFEVLEHLDNPRVLLDKLHAPLWWSIPIENMTAYHKRPYTIGEIMALVPGACAYQTVEGAISSEIPTRARNGYILGFWRGDE